MVEWKDFAEPSLEDRSELEDAEALEKFESISGTGDGIEENFHIEVFISPNMEAWFTR